MSEDFKVGDMKELKNLKITSGVFGFFCFLFLIVLIVCFSYPLICFVPAALVPSAIVPTSTDAPTEPATAAPAPASQLFRPRQLMANRENYTQQDKEDILSKIKKDLSKFQQSFQTYTIKQ